MSYKKVPGRPVIVICPSRLRAEHVMWNGRRRCWTWPLWSLQVRVEHVCVCVCVYFESSKCAECEQQDHDQASLLGALHQGGEVVDVCRSLNAECGGERVNDGVVSDAP